MANEKSDDKLQIEGVLEFGYGITPMMIIADKRVSNPAVRLYGALANFARGKGSAFPKQKRLASILGVSVQRVSELSSELEMYGYVTKTREGKNGGLTYQLNMTLASPVERDLFGDFVVDKMKTKNPKKESKSSVSKKDLDELSEYYIEQFMKVSGGIKPDYRYARDNAIFAGYLKTYEDVDLIKRVLDAYFLHPWGEKCGFTVSSLQSVFNKLLIEVRNNKGNNDGYGFTS